jgi:hypothetical protein
MIIVIITQQSSGGCRISVQVASEIRFRAGPGLERMSRIERRYEADEAIHASVTMTCT